MDKKSKVLFIIFLLIVIISITITFYKYIILEDVIFYTNEELFNESLLGE